MKAYRKVRYPQQDKKLRKIKEKEQEITAEQAIRILVETNSLEMGSRNQLNDLFTAEGPIDQRKRSNTVDSTTIRIPRS